MDPNNHQRHPHNAAAAAASTATDAGLMPPSSTSANGGKPDEGYYVSLTDDPSSYQRLSSHGLPQAQQPHQQPYDLLNDDYPRYPHKDHHHHHGHIANNTSNHDNDDASSILTEEGIHDFTGFCCVCLVMLIGDMSRGVMFPSMWPLVQSLGGTEVTLGYAVASFSFGRALVNPVFGHMSNVKGYTPTLVLSTAILLLGTLLYAQVPNFGTPQSLIASQTVLGIGSGTLGVTRAFVADVTAKRHRTKYMGLITAVQYGGFTVTPIFGAFFNHWLSNVDVHVGIVRWNMFTAPAYFMGTIVAVTLVTLLTCFRGRRKIITTTVTPALDATTAAPPPVATDDPALDPEKDGIMKVVAGTTLPPAPKVSARRLERDAAASALVVPWIPWLTVSDCAILGCMLLNVSTKGSIASFETLGIAVAQQHFALTSAVAGTIVACCGAIGVVALLSMGHLEQRCTDVQLVAGGMVVMVAGIASLSTVEHRDPYHNSPFLYGTAMFLIYAIGYPIGHTAVIGLFSKSTSKVLT